MTLIDLHTGSHIVASGVRTVTTAGTAVQLTAQRCKRVLLQADEDNGSTIIAVGDVNVDADSDPPRGRMLYSTQAESFNVQDASELYIDATVSGGKVHYLVEG